MNEEFSWLRPIITLCSAAFVLGLILHVCQESARRHAGLEAETAAAIAAFQTNRSGEARFLSPSCRIIPAHALPAFPLTTPEAPTGPDPSR